MNKNPLVGFLLGVFIALVIRGGYEAMKSIVQVVESLTFYPQSTAITVLAFGLIGVAWVFIVNRAP